MEKKETRVRRQLMPSEKAPSIVLSDDSVTPIALPNRALILFERAGDDWYPVRAHAWRVGSNDTRSSSE
jgi:hypothetical protein